MTVTSFSIQIGILLEMKNDLGLALAIQSIIYLFSTRMVIKFVKNEFLYILKNITSELDKYFISLSLAQFVTIVIIQLYFRKGGYSYWGIIAVTLIGLTATISYHLIYIMVRNFKSINSLKEIAYWDNLTAIKNRLALFIDCEKLIAEKKPFTVIYMDLDNFKKVNDLYGHSVGDNYLKQFTKASIEAIGHHGSLYRMSGDEFVCIYDEDEIDIFLETFNDKIMDLFEINIPFLGVSIGYAKFPDDADSLEKLIDKADTIMYKVKSIKHKPFVMTREWDVPKSFKQ